MSSHPDNLPLIIRAKEYLQIDSFSMEVMDYLGLLTPGVHYFKVKLLSDDSDTISPNLGLLRVGSVEGSLNRELKLRESLGDYKIVAELLAHKTEESVLINPPLLLDDLEDNLQEQPIILPIAENSESLTDNSTDSHQEENILSQQEQESDHIPQQEIDEFASSIATPDNCLELTNDLDTEETNSNYLEEEFYEEKNIFADDCSEKLLLLTYLPAEEKTIHNWLKENHSSEEYLSVAIQICQFLAYLNKNNWCFINLIPQLIKVGKPSIFFDLTTAYPIGETPTCGLIEEYYAPELATAHEFHEPMASYVVGAFLYQCFHQKLPLPNQELEFDIHPIPRIYQLLKICLSPVPEERFPLSQLRDLLVETRKLFSIKKIQWQVASNSTIGLSTSRLSNEDNYGVRQQQLSNSESLIMGVVADGMGGMAQGEIASQIAVKTVLEEPIPQQFSAEKSRADWLISLFQKANESISHTVKDGGTTLSLVLAISDSLMVAHVGDSRIYLLRQGEIKQISEDHSLVAMLVASGQITPAESLEHPDRNILTKSLGSTRRLSEGYVQDLRRTTNQLSLTLEDNDILLLCSDGVWDLVNTEEIAEFFISSQSLQSAVDQTIDRVLARGASDNATLLALQCKIQQGS